MKTYYLKSTNKESLYLALSTAGLVHEWEGNTTPLTGVALDEIGTINKPTGVLSEPDADGFKYPIMSALDGYHANLLAELTPNQELMLPLVAAPKTPSRVWA